MDQEIRNKLRNVVTQCRKLLEDDTGYALEGRFGIFARKDQVTADPSAKMAHLSDEEQAARKDILDHYAHIKARGFGAKAALDQLIREIAFTHLNRLCAYKMMEAREVYVGGQKFREAVSRGVNSNGVRFYLAEHPEDERLFNTGHQDVAYRHFLDWLGGALSDEIGVLFNPNDPANRLYPRQKTLDEVLDLLNGGGIKAEETELRDQWPQIWSQDETIGWVYQYFTPKELRDQARKESQAPRNSYELAFRNQFFTPRYVVEFLTDNTLGRIWYEMRRGDTNLKDQCRYLVRRPTEMFLKDGEQPSKDAAEGKDDLSQEELLKLPVHIPHRPKKDPRELKILDPACGSGHFLLYCFDLLLTIYEEAYADPDLGPALKKDYPTLDALKRDVPRLILAHNLHGIDIDLRASQIAALVLWLRCQRAYQDMGFKKDRPQITRSNFVCAEPMPGEEQMLKEFVGQLKPKVLGQVVEVVFDKMKLAGEAGSLLKIEEEIRDAIREAKRQYAIGGISIQRTLFDKPTVPVVKVFSVKDITDIQFFESAEAQVIEALRSYAEMAQNGQRLRRRLFSEDAVRGFAFVDLCQKQYDVVLMNPPFGQGVAVTSNYMKRRFDRSSFDLFAAFLTRGSNVLHLNGLLGAITTSAGFYRNQLEDWRAETYLSGHFVLCADLGGHVLDEATVRAASYVLSQSCTNSHSLVCRCNEASSKSEALHTAITQLQKGLPVEYLFLASTTSLSRLPGRPFAYWLPRRFQQKISQLKCLADAGGVAQFGLSTKDDFQFLRLAWEIPVRQIGRNAPWCYVSKGGEYSPYYYDIHLLVRHEDNLNILEQAIIRKYPYLGDNAGWVLHRENNYYDPGITFQRRTNKSLAPRVLPRDCMFTDNGPTAFWPEVPLATFLALFNSSVVQLLAAVGNGAFEAEGGGGANSYEVGVINNIVLPELTTDAKGRLAECALKIVRLKQMLLESRPDSRFFTAPRTYDITAYRELVFSARRQIEDIQDRINQEVCELYGFTPEAVEKVLESVSPTNVTSEEDDEASEHDNLDDDFRRAWHDAMSWCVGVIFGRWDIRNLLCLSEVPVDPFASLPACPPGMLLGDDRVSLDSDAESYPLAIQEDGILTDDPENECDVLRRMQSVHDVAWKEQANQYEMQSCEILGAKQLRDYFRKPGKGGFWDDHISRYSKSRRKAPIYWLLQSSKKNYALWLYYHRFDKDLLFKALVNYVEPKIRLETNRLESLRSQKSAAGESGKEAKRLARDVERQEDFLSELRDFEDKLRRAANLHLEPDLNDGVVLNIAPLWELVPWKEAKSYWDELLKGEYEWSSIGKQLRQKGLVK